MDPTPDAPHRPSPETDVVDVAARLRLAIARLARQLRQQAGTGLSPSQQSVLTSIALQGSITLGELAALEQVAPPTITRIVTKLADDGLVERTTDQSDRRVARVSVSAEGRRRLARSRERRDAWLAQRLEGLPAAEIDRLAAALDALEALAASGAPPSPPGPPPGDAPDPAGSPDHPSTAGSVAP
jgi:DNA-binding MarR family transcriptional regulator